ncbi:MAG: hypothetical protein R2818_02600 [Flavobacteriales bacterium]
MSTVDLNKGLSIQVEGEAGKYHTLRVEDLIEIARNLEKLVLAIAKSDIDTGEAVDWDNFRIELAGFSAGSAVTTWVPTPRIQMPLADLDKQRAVVSERFEQIMQVADKGHYTDLKKLYPDAMRRNEVVGALYAFRNSVPDAPMALVELGKRKGAKPKKLYAIKPFRKEVRELLITRVVEQKKEGVERIAVARVKLLSDAKGNVVSTKRLEVFKKENTSVAWSPPVIVHDGKAFVLRYPLTCTVEHEDKVYAISNHMLGIIGTGANMDEAEDSFAEEFDFLYRRYTAMPDRKLAPHLVEVKRLLKHLVIDIEG